MVQPLFLHSNCYATALGARVPQEELHLDQYKEQAWKVK